MTLFPNETHKELWLENWCDRCAQPGGSVKCSILLNAIRTDRKPPEWTTSRDDFIQTRYRCEKFLRKPPVLRRPEAQCETLPMFEVEEMDYRLVPVEGWPDYRRHLVNEVDHQ